VAAEPDTNDPRAYIRMASLIRKQIAEGKLQPGDPTPSIGRLVRDYGYARQTCAQALRVLVNEGLAHRVPGLGYHVTADVADRLRDQPEQPE
jgi:GntR family transcriptional regulator